MDDRALGRIQFSTDTFPERDRFPMVREEFARSLLTVSCINRSNNNFAATFDIQSIGRLAIGHIDTSPADYVRTPELIRDHQEFLFVTFPLAGAMLTSQTGSMERLIPGEAVLLDSTHVGGIHFEAKARYVTTRIARSQIATALPPGTQLIGNKLDASPEARRLLVSYLGTTRNIDLSTNPRMARLYDEHALDLVLLAIGGQGEVARLAQRRGVRAARRSEILRLIATRSGDPAFGVGAVARALDVTPRYVHLLLEETGQSFAHHVLAKRLEMAAALLRDPAWNTRRIADVALEVGFTEFSYFSRTFRRHYGATPTDMREAARTEARQGG